MADVRVEFVRLGIGPLHSGGWTNLIEGPPYKVATLSVGAAATPAAERPQAPAFGPHASGHARVTALYGAVVVAFGTDPTASAAGQDGLRLEAGTVELLPVRPGDLLSFVEVL